MAVTTTSLAVKDGNVAAQSMLVHTDPAGILRYGMSLDAAGAACYRASIAFTLGVATPTAYVVLQGSATKTIRVTGIKVEGWSTTAGVMKHKVSRRTTAGTVGSAVLTAIPTQGKNDSGTVASPTLVISTVGTANYTTLGTLSAILDTGVAAFNLAAQVSNSRPYIPVACGQWGAQAFVLRGTSDWLTIDGGADGGGDAVPAGGISNVTVEWIEDGS